MPLVLIGDDFTNGVRHMANEIVTDADTDMGNEIVEDTETDEVEILEFLLGDQSFGINVAKVMQILAFDESRFTAIPGDNGANRGVLLWQKKTIPLIDLNCALNRKKQELSERPIVIVTRFYEVTNGFLISDVNKIHRVSWEKVKPIESIFSKYSSNVTGSISIGDKEILLVDFEYIIAELFPDTKMDYDLKDIDLKRELVRDDLKIIYSEDSTFIRKNISGLLKKVGFNHVTAFENGQDAFDHIHDLVTQAHKENKPISDFINLVISDIEMPKMDGLTLCKKIKKEMGLSDVPVALFSSLIDEQMSIKCKEAGADLFTNKPKIAELIVMIDDLLHVGESN